MKKSILILFFALLGMLSARAYDFAVDGIYYSIISSGTSYRQAAVTFGNEKYTGSVVIPGQVVRNGDHYHVTAIGDRAFDSCTGLTSVTFSYTEIESIRAYAFRNCSGLTSVTIPERVTSIGAEAFKGCTGLTSVRIPENVTSIGYKAFSGTSITRPLYNSKVFAYMPQDYSGEYEIPSGIESIADGAFSGCTGLTSVTIPNSVTSIGKSAFEGCSGLTSVTIPKRVTYIGSDAFDSCTGLTSVEWNAVDCQDFKYDISSYWKLYPPFYNCENITSITFGNQVEHIPAYLCYGLDSLTSVTIPEGVTSIGKRAFAGRGLRSVEWNVVACQDLKADDYPFGSGINYPYGGVITSISFGNQVARIPAYLCYGLDSLTSVTIPERLDTIGQGAFYGCNNLLTVTSLAKRPPCCINDEHSVFSVYDGTLYVPQGRKSAYESAFEWFKFSKIEEFSGISTVTVQSNDESMGRVTGSGQYRIGDQAVLAAIPNQGYHFVKWDDGVTANPRILTVTEDITLTAIFAEEGDEPTANEKSEADNLRVYVQDRTIHLSEDRGAVQVYNMAGQRIYNGHATAIPVPQSGVYIVAVGQQRIKVVVR